MRLTKIALALIACMALGALAANAAQAQWTIQGTTFPAGGESITCARHGSGDFTLTTTVGGIPITLTAQNIDCEFTKINNGTGMETDHSEGFLNFTEVTVSNPSTCSVTGGHLTTEFLTDRVIMDEAAGGDATRTFDTFFTENGAAWVRLSLQGAECPFAGAEPGVFGTACGEAVHTSAGSFVPNKTGEFFTPQTLLFGMTQQTTANSTTNPCKLTLGKAEATISGAVDNVLSGANEGKAFAAD